MLTLALDEAGKFDTGTKGSPCDSETTLIGGVIFDDCKIEGEAAREKQRLEAYYKTVVYSVNKTNKTKSRFPWDLHSKGNNHRKVKLIKERITDTIGEFLQKGTFEGKELSNQEGLFEKREGKYYICAVVKSEAGKDVLLRNELGNFFRDGVASNTYFHMVSEAVEHFIFHNPLFPKADDFCLDIATRQSAIIEEEYTDDYIAQGMKANDREDLGDEKQFSLMDADVFRTIMTEQMLNDKSKDIVISSFNVRSISYFPKRNYEDQIFLYLADSICSLLTYKMKKNDINGVIKKAQNLLNNNALVFLYDETDEYFKRAWRAVESGEYCKALSETFRLKCMPSDEAELYKEKWIPFIEQSIKKHITEEGEINDISSVFFSEVQKLRNKYMTNSLNAEEAFYIFGIFKETSDMLLDNNKSKKLVYYLNDIGVKAFCHRGDTAKAEPYYKNCEQLACAVDIEEYIRTRNQYATALCDVFNFEKAVQIARETIALAKGIYELSRQIRGKDKAEHFGKTEFAKTLSLAGQFASFMKDNESGLSLYDDALKFMENNRANIKITESYKLHLLIQMGDKEKFKETMMNYCDGAVSDKEQFDTIRRMAERGDINERYALYVFMKGLYFFKQDQELSEVWSDLKSRIEDISNESKMDHPWELIYKYYGLLSARMNEKYIIKDCISWIDKVSESKKDTLISVIATESKAELQRICNNRNEEEELHRRVYDVLLNKYHLFYDAYEVSDIEENKRKIQDKLTYMYY